MKYGWLPGLLVLTVGLGCGKSGPAIAPVSGSVSLDGVPLAEGVVSFVSTKGYVSSARLDADGRFQLVSQYGNGIPLDTYRVCVLPGNQAPDENSMKSRRPSLPSKIPLRYQYPDRSGILATIEDRENDLQLSLSTLP